MKNKLTSKKRTDPPQIITIEKRIRATKTAMSFIADGISTAQNHIKTESQKTLTRCKCVLCNRT